MRAGNLPRLLALAVSLLAPTSARAGQPPKGPRALTANVTLALPAEVYPDLPCIAAVTVTNVCRKPARAKKPDADPDVQSLVESLRAQVSFPAFDLLDVSPPVAVAVRDAQGKTVKAGVAPSPYAFWSRPPAVFEHPRRRPTVALAPGATGSFVVDLAPWLVGLPPGEYTIALVLHGDEHGPTWRSNDVRIRRASVTADERRAVADAFPETRRPTENRPRAWLNRDIVVTPLKARLRKGVFAAVVPYVFLSAAARGRYVAEAPINLLDSFPKHLQPTAESLRYEFLFVTGRRQEAEKVRQDLLRAIPALRWRVVGVENGSGLLRTAVQVTSAP